MQPDAAGMNPPNLPDREELERLDLLLADMVAKAQAELERLTSRFQVNPPGHWPAMSSQATSEGPSMTSARQKRLGEENGLTPRANSLVPAVIRGVAAHETAGVTLGVNFSQGGERLWAVHQRHSHVQQDNAHAVAMPLVKV